MRAATNPSVRRLAAAAIGLAMVPALMGCGGDDGDGRGTAPGAASAASGLRLTITTDNGVRLRPTDGDEVGVDQAVAHHWSRHDGARVLDLNCRDQEGSGRPCPRMPEIDVPAGIAVTVTARNAGIDAAGLSGPLDLTTVNGDVTVADSGADDASLRLVTRNGSVHTTSVRASALGVRTVNGDVTLDCATAPRRVSARTVNGSVDVAVPHDAPGYRVDATTDNGRPAITLPDAAGGSSRTMTLATVNGDVRADRL
ncbi:DUF4097 family beta strand repeat-containing protein [Streptomyces sp. NPDC016845]|uniref:DUF4097 family beta strand repeat-containing protein n=1 Tax=Streptomyces sp. NPDC016845 TaxID=3364972 RepID=UPI00379E4292